MKCGGIKIHLAYAFGMLQGGLLMCNRGGYEMWWDKKIHLAYAFGMLQDGFFYFVPVEPKPPSPLSVSSSSSTSLKSAVMYGAKTICAILSFGSMVTGLSEWLWRATMISPL
mgnify:FL=1|jgi:hypothetical protein